MIEEIYNSFQKLDISLTDYKKEQFYKYFNLLVDYNNKVNLTAITDEKEVYIKHFIDSVISYKFIPQNAYICDIGTGAGFPAIPLKIIRPDLKLLLIDSLEKRTKFLSILADELNLNNVEIIHCRAEDIGNSEKYREKCDICVSRGVAKLNTLSEYCLPLVKVGGKMIAYKSFNIDDELIESEKAIKEFGGNIDEIKEIQLPNTDIIRKLVIIKKERQTPSKYPRGLNKPKLQPIQ